jgi:hypothetical protein
MTGIALFSGFNMRGVHTCSLGSVVTAGAATGGIYIAVIKTGVRPVRGGVMADIALLTGLDMQSMFTCCTGAVVTG